MEPLLSREDLILVVAIALGIVSAFNVACSIVDFIFGKKRGGY